MSEPASMPTSDAPHTNTHGKETQTQTQKRKLSDASYEGTSDGSESGEISSQPSKKRHLTRDQVANGHSQVDNGTADSTMVTNATADDVASGASSQKGGRGWNQSTAGAVRTSFSSFSSTIKSAPQKQAAKIAPPTRLQPSKGGENAKGSTVRLPDSGELAADGGSKAAPGPSNSDIREKPMTFRKAGRSWDLPPLPEGLEHIKEMESLRIKFARWCETLVDRNETHTFSDEDHGLMVEAYAHRIDSAPWMTRKARRAAINATHRSKERIRQHVAVPQYGEAGLFPDQLPPESLGHLQRYYPGIPEDAVFCVLCTSTAHRQDACPSKICRFCQAQDHPAHFCPTRKRCLICKQLGHPVEDCQEKLSRAPGEDTECAFCQGGDHEEENCVVFRRSFRPGENDIRRVKSIPIYCYSCGAEGHFGTQCGLSRESSRPVLQEIWSQENCQRYVDQNSTEVAIVLDPTSGPHASSWGADDRPNFGGKSMARPTHVVFEDDDDDDEEGFIRPPVQRPPPLGQIRFQSNNVGAPGTTTAVPGGRGGRNQRNGGRRPKAPANPPLPPGPPPPLPPQNLPPRPPPPTSQNRGPAPPNNRGKKQKGNDNNNQKPGQKSGQADDQAPPRRNRRSRRGNAGKGKGGKA